MQVATYAVILTPTAQSPETTDDIIATTKGTFIGFNVQHDGANNPTVEFFDGTVAAGTKIYSRLFTASDEVILGVGLKVAKLSCLTTIAGGTTTVVVYFRA